MRRGDKVRVMVPIEKLQRTADKLPAGEYIIYDFHPQGGVSIIQAGKKDVAQIFRLTNHEMQRQSIEVYES